MPIIQNLRVQKVKTAERTERR